MLLCVLVARSPILGSNFLILNRHDAIELAWAECLEQKIYIYRLTVIALSVSLGLNNSDDECARLLYLN